MMSMVHSFEPVIDENCQVLVLGSMPGVPSLTLSEYYGNPRNYFWRVLYGLFGQSTVDDEYEERLAFALSHRVALWDVLKSCTREGSLDSNIRNEVVNDIPGLLKRYPSIRCLALNGTKAHDTFMRHFGKTDAARRVVCLKLPSTSPVPTRTMRNLDDRLAAWRAIVPYLGTS
ncbi:DNA-deoxyinosine glycosylase [Paenibacillus xylaniclasticus]|uniref:DNA-deoxyinosine glycosylase n=1 Tax=Paenibacillus xylaniclasticus TaxID=588083 RepID=UPI000FDCD166|nr:MULTISPECIES: DNA-deoxyinosine glycosylase [Paenibacillus]GFN34019.1 DNA-deoxyinosine glycosylase [Paenibacillus curdlanolyticus]